MRLSLVREWNHEGDKERKLWMTVGTGEKGTRFKGLKLSFQWNLLLVLSLRSHPFPNEFTCHRKKPDIKPTGKK